MSTALQEELSEGLVGFLSKKVVPMMVRPLIKLKEVVMPSEKEKEASNSTMLATEDESEPMTLEGTLSYKKGGKGNRKPFPWKRRYVVLDMADGGSVSCFRVKDKSRKNMLRQMYTKLNRDSNEMTVGAPSRENEVCLYIPSDIPWIVRDVYMDSRMFCIEIPTTDDKILDHVENNEDDDDDDDDGSELSFSTSEDQLVEVDFDQKIGTHMEHSPSLSPLPEETSVMDETALESLLADELYEDIFEAQKQSKKRLRFYFRCGRSGNEKALWLRALAKIERMSSEPSRKGRVMGSVNKVLAGNSRIRSEISASFASQTRQLERMSNSSIPFSDRMIEEDTSNVHLTPSGKEFRVVPTYAYPHRWMTSAELREEMLLPSSHFHDLSVRSRRGQEIGTLKVEVLQCLGLPKLDRSSETDAVVYLVCGSYAFSTDVINDMASPMWLRKSRRACIFPIFHGYARLYCGVFDDDGKSSKDDLAGRVVLDLARLRPGSNYDVTLPLRMSSHVYSKRKRGSIRLRFQLDWKSERAALLSYIPRKVPNPKNLKPYDDVTVLCSDEKAFRNVAITVHGAHLPGRFSPKHFKAMLREINFTRKAVIITLRTTIKDTIMWRNPVISSFVFVAWMHCINKNQFSLVPAYLIIYLLLHLARNYARYGMDGPTQLGLIPVSWEEMFRALLTGDGHTSCFQPLEMQCVDPMKSMSMSRSDMDLLSTYGGVDYAFKTHVPWGKSELRLLGFLPSEEASRGTKVEDEHLEFPFGSMGNYPRFTVEESLVERANSKSKSKRQVNADPRSMLNGASSKLWSGASRYAGGAVGPDTDVANGMLFEEDVEQSMPRTGSGDMMEEVFDTLGAGLDTSFSPDDAQVGNTINNNMSFDSGSSATRMPEQDIDRAGGGNKDKSLVEDLQEVKSKIHDLTLQLFNDQAYTIKDPSSVYFGQAQSSRRASKRGANEDASKQLDRLLGLGEYSSGNMVVSRVAPFVEPIVGSATAFLCLFRALFNIFTWRDPFLSFWVTLLMSVLAAILLVFPWRLVLFAVGVVVVGPQNLFFRLLRERTESIRQRLDQESASAGEDAPVSGDAPSKVESGGDDDADMIESTLPEDQPVFKSHGEPNQKSTELDLSEVNPREVHHVVVPYSQLKYQRMYDWPPEPQYARVKIPPKPKPTPMVRKISDSRRSNLDDSNVRRRSRTYAVPSTCIHQSRQIILSNSPSTIMRKKMK